MIQRSMTTSRRTFLRASALLLLGAGAAHGYPVPPTRAAPRTAVWNGITVRAGTPGAVPVLARNGATEYALLDHRVTPLSLDLYSKANDNQTFTFAVALSAQPSDRWHFLELDGIHHRASSIGRGGGSTSAWFTFDRPTAEAVASAMRVTLRERTQLDADLRYRWDIPSRRAATSKTPLPITLHITNTGAATVGVQLGGRQRGTRDNQFMFTAARNGKPLPIKDAPDLGGATGIHVVAPGQSVAVTCPDLRAWLDLDRPGRVVLAARWESTLSKDGKSTSAVADRANVWDIAPTGQATIVVK